jgi:hypothetical protein
MPATTRRKIATAPISKVTVPGARALADRLERAGTTRVTLDRVDLRLGGEFIHTLLAHILALQPGLTEIKLCKDVEP